MRNALPICEFGQTFTLYGPKTFMPSPKWDLQLHYVCTSTKITCSSTTIINCDASFFVSFFLIALKPIIFNNSMCFNVLQCSNELQVEYSTHTHRHLYHPFGAHLWFDNIKQTTKLHIVWCEEWLLASGQLKNYSFLSLRIWISGANAENAKIHVSGQLRMHEK